ncbi:MAG: alpha/beta fold hydrolase [Alphaproteobacteria bacterium]|nr:alpha/beta fold hydrolase [Alphaproteobacteria bacterium]
MPFATTDDGVRLHYEEVGQGRPLVFVHEFAGDLRSWDAQLRFFGRYYRCIAFNARGYPPSDVPESDAHYSVERAADDIAAVLDHLRLDHAHIVGLSMGGFATLHFGLRHHDRAHALAICGCGYGAEKDKRARFQHESEELADRFERDGSAKVAERYAEGTARVQLQNKDPRAWREFSDRLAAHSAKGSANTLRGVQARRPSLYDLVERMTKITAPTLIVAGDEDEACLQPGILMKRAIATSGLVILPKTGHLVNLEDPALFNRTLADFLLAVELGRWPARDSRSLGGDAHGTR